MSDLFTDLTPRRGFVARFAAAAAALGATLHGRPTGGQQPITATVGRRRDTARDAIRDAASRASDWDVSWVERIKAPHRQVFDAPEVLEGMPLHQVRAWLQGYEDVYGPSGKDANAVLVVRHFGIPLVMGDELWERYQLGQKMAAFTPDKQPLKDPATGAPARRHPYLNANAKPGDKHVSMYLWPDGGMDSLLQRQGVIVLACNMALQYMADHIVVPQDGVSKEEALGRLKAGLLPGVIVQPSGIFAVGRAQEAGCRYIYSA